MRRRQLNQSRRDWIAAPHGPFGPVNIQAPTAGELAGTGFAANFGRSGRATEGSMSMTAFFEYLNHHEATGELAQALAHAAMLRTTGARPVRGARDEQRIAS